MRDHTRRLPTLVVAAAVLGAGGLACRLILANRAGNANASLRRLANAAGPTRAIMPRLTGGFGHAPCTLPEDDARLISGLLCNDSTGPETRARLLRFSAGFRERHAGDTTGPGRHTAGVFALLWPAQEGSVERAVNQLKAAARQRPADAGVWSDLSAGLLAAAQVSQDPRALIEAQAVADSALALDPGLAEARFNRALALEWLYLPEDAATAWRQYLEADPGSGWAAEARRHLEALSRAPPGWDEQAGLLARAVSQGDTGRVAAVVEAFPWRARELVDNALLAWASLGGGDSLLALAGAVARALGRATGDALPLEAMEALGPTRSRMVANGLLALDAGRARRAAGDLAGAEELLTRSSRLLQGAGSPWYLWADYFLGGVWYDRGDAASLDRVVRLLRGIRERAPARYRVVRAYAARTEGLIYHLRAQYHDAITAYTAAITEAQGTVEPELLVRVRSWLAQVESELRGDGPAWRNLYAALKLTPRFPDAHLSRRYLFVRVAEEAWRANPRLAVRYHGESIRAAQATGEPGRVALSLAWRAELLARLGEESGALADVEAANTELARVPNDTAAADVRAYLDLVSGLAGLQNHPGEAIEALHRALVAYRQSDSFLQARGYLYLANAHLAAGQPDSANDAFASAVAQTERQRAGIPSPQERAQFLDYARPVFDRITRFHADRDDPERALEFFERARGRVLLEQALLRRPEPGAAGAPVRGADLRRLLPEGHSLVSYAVLGDEILIWVVRPAGVRLVRVPISEGELSDLVDRFRETILLRAAAAEWRQVSARLYGLLVQPIAGLVAGDRRLVVIPDKALHLLPFAGLWDAESERYLIQRFEISVVPSAGVFAAERRRRAAPGGATPRALVIGDPTFDREAYPLAPLPGAELEARRVAANYQHPRLLVGAAATRAAFLAAAPGYDIIHFAGHAVVRSDAPLSSHLVFAAGGDGQGALYSREVFQLNLSRTRLAVLSACQTSSGRLSPTEGPSSLARAFFAAGVPVVVASLWAVEDQRTAEFFGLYHQRLSAGGDPVAALRATQLAWIETSTNRDDAAVWSAFQAFGTTAPASRPAATAINHPATNRQGSAL